MYKRQTVGLSSERWGGLHIGATYVDEMQETYDPEVFSDSHVVFDVSASLNVTDEISLYGKVQNLLNNEYIVSRSPFGARPGRPRFVLGGVKVNIDRD